MRRSDRSSDPPRRPAKADSKGGRRLLFGTTSYVLPDDILPNVRLLAGLVDDIELILFEGDAGNLPSPRTVRELRRLAEEGDCGFTVHLPLDVGIGEDDPSSRTRAVEVCRRVIDLTRGLEPRSFVIHPELPLRFHPDCGQEPDTLLEAPPELSGVWPATLGESLAVLRDEAADVPVAVENLQFPYEWVWGLVEELGLHTVLDVGHLVKDGGDVATFLERYGRRLSVVHLHGVVDGRDHRPVGAWGREGLRSLLEAFAGTGGLAESTPSASEPLVVTLEVFGGAHTTSSLQALAGAVEPEEPGRAARLNRAARRLEEALGRYR